MSLTTLITEPEVRDQLKKLIRRPDFDGKRKLLAPPLTKNYMLVGTAFDYLFRFYLKRMNPQAIESSGWVAENSLDELFGFKNGFAHNLDTNEIDVIPELADQEDEAMFNKIKNILSESRNIYQAYLKTGRVTEKLLRSAIQLAKLDGIFRGGLTGQMDLADIDKRDLNDLQKLVNAIPAGDFKEKTVCVLNPTFGEASRLVGGADADVIIDDTLIEIKTTQKCRLLSNHLRQLAGYYCLYRISGVTGVPADKPLRRLGVYFSRYGYLYTVPITKCWKARDFKAFLSWFEDFIRAREQNH